MAVMNRIVCVLVLISSVFAGEELQEYKKMPGVAGEISSIGSDTLNNLMSLWGEAFRKYYPNVRFQVEGKGSAAAPVALTEGIAQLGPMSRLMQISEIESFEKKHGYKPTPIYVAVDCVAIYVNKDNPIHGLTLQQIDGIFSETRNGGLNESINTWGQLGITGILKDRQISLYGRNSASGTYVFFAEAALFKGDYKKTLKEQPGSAAVVGGIAGEISGIGYSGIGYKTSDVRIVPIAKKNGDPFVTASFENAINGSYPLGRLLIVYIAKKPGMPLPDSTREFIKFILSKEGQEIVLKDGYGALPAAQIEKQLALIE